MIGSPGSLSGSSSVPEEVMEEGLFVQSDENEVPPLRSSDRSWWLTTPPPPRKKTRRGLPLSPSKIKITRQCPKQAYERWVNKRYSPSGPEAIIGKLVHGAYEDAGNLRVHRTKQRNPPPVASIEELLHLLEHQPAQLYRGQETCEVSASMLAEAREIVVSGGAIDFTHTVACEAKITLPIQVGLPKIGGVIDRIDVETKKNGGHKVKVIDYKTERVARDATDLIDDPQTGVYLNWAAANYKDAEEISFQIYNPRLGEWSEEVVYNDYLGSLTESMCAVAAHVVQAQIQTAQPGTHCRYCHIKDGDQDHPPCEEYHKFMARKAEGGIGAEGLAKLTMPALVREFHLVKTRAKLHDARQKELRAEILKRLTTKKWSDGVYSATVSTPSSTTYPNPAVLIKDLAELTGHDLVRLMARLISVKSTNLKEWVATLPPEKKIAAEYLVRYHSRPGFGGSQLRTREVPQIF